MGGHLPTSWVRGRSPPQPEAVAAGWEVAHGQRGHTLVWLAFCSPAPLGAQPDSSIVPSARRAFALLLSTSDKPIGVSSGAQPPDALPKK
jgi:hypothetical protein